MVDDTIPAKMAVSAIVLVGTIGVSGVFILGHNLNEVRNKLKETQKQINTFVQENPDKGEWVCAFGENTFTLNGKEITNRKDLREIIEAGIKNGSCRARLITAARPSGAAPNP